MKPVVEGLQLHRRSRQLEVSFSDGQRFMLPCEYLRVNSPSAEVQGHHPSQRVLVAGKREVNISAIEPVGHYAVCLRFTDGHASGIYSWDTLYRLGQEQAERWPAYLAELQRAGLSRDPPG
ncbi:gamma-butyrobetaine hydroxylase-like domain-containing protein [Pseudomarimonas arenosa]|uniref:DUF971 domain-containing protein n=1 Tax=Pseudomarimonas arenosa TaxID=2774145 RepID=A0AAW3ZL62_9GAMM|nr:DUF971 domain-containing protein [Pseudomarimonas arenosa]MBD8525161.1 DUF971 domain-containing protein [Pseudomarimonas arenosa]